MGGQTIDSAPRDGTRVMLWVPKMWMPKMWGENRSTFGAFDSDEYVKKPKPFWRFENFQSVPLMRANPPTHWQPMPDPPSGEDSKKV